VTDRARPWPIRALAAGATLLLLLVAWIWSNGEAVGRLAREQERLRDLQAGLRAQDDLGRRVAELESRLERVEQVARPGARSGRDAEHIALRRWLQRLDAEIAANRARLARDEVRLDSLHVDPTLSDALR